MLLRWYGALGGYKRLSNIFAGNIPSNGAIRASGFSTAPVRQEFTLSGPQLARLKYLATKRGILENELIFERFFSGGGWEALISGENAAGEVELFQAFLEEYDWDIFAWISGQRAVPEPYQSSRLFSLLLSSSRAGVKSENKGKE